MDGTVSFKIFDHLREKYKNLEKSYKRLKAQYKKNAITAKVEEDWSKEDAEKEEDHPSQRNIRPFIRIINQINQKVPGFSNSLTDGIHKELEVMHVKFGERGENWCAEQGPFFKSEKELPEELEEKYNIKPKVVPASDKAIQVQPKKFDEVTQTRNLKKFCIETQTTHFENKIHHNKNKATQLNLPPIDQLSFLRKIPISLDS